MSNAMTAPTQSSSVWIAGQYDPYVCLACAWTSPGRYYQTELTFSIDGIVDENLTTSIVLPMPVAMPAPITLYWSLERQLLVQFSSPKLLTGMAPEHISTMQQITALLLKAPSSRGNPKKEDYVVPFVPNIPPEQFEDWLKDNDGTELVMESFERDPAGAPMGFIRDTSIYAEARIFINWVVDQTKQTVSMECQSLPQRRNLLNPATMYQGSKMGGSPALPPKVQVFPATGCTVSKVPAQTGIVGRFFSAILDRFEATLVAQELASTILKGVGFNDIGHVLTAITMPIAQARTDYQLYEFFGDSVLKYTVACQLYYANPTWQEARLSVERDKFISNANLTRSALLAGLDAYILADRFTPTSWSAPSMEEKLSREIPKRQLANKVIADVVEALIGAAYMDGGMEKAQTCLYRFLPEVDILQDGLPSHCNRPMAGKGPGYHHSASSLGVGTDRGPGCDYPTSLGVLLGYTFNDPSLLSEALTHASGSHDGSQSYNRLEYLGDAVLDMIVVSSLAILPQKIPQGQMTLLKHALTNANLLAFLCMGLYIEDQDPSSDPIHPPKRIHLYDFLRYNGDITDKARKASIARYNTYREETTTALQSSDQYPWLPLAQMHADKFFCDIVESTIGAIFVDSRGDMEACTSFAERVGILPILRRFIQDGVDVQHPRNKAQGILKEERMVEFKITGVLKNYTCTARYGPKQGPLEAIQVVEGVAFREEAEVRASYLAIPILFAREAANAEKDEKTRLERGLHRGEQKKLKRKKKREAELAMGKGDELGQSDPMETQ
jgi:dsRNA-specific ribonuclease